MSCEVERCECDNEVPILNSTLGGSQVISTDLQRGVGAERPVNRG